ncbi:MAG: FG-GAP-like repeat-containing protein [Gammaproteobacteria bacterium]|nr:FG-GAP-like repeat-containing protein [Gammaproteobacteria bacterium]
MSVLCALLGTARADWFEDATIAAGVNDQDNSFGVSWGDLNGDGYPDVYLSNHWHTPTLYLNQQDGTFVDVQDQHDVAMGHIDVHACTWGDYNNDGDQDLIKAVGGFTAGGGIPDTPYFDNIGGTLQLGDGQATGLNYAYSGRAPVWLDENSDGLLDMLMVSRPRVAGFYTAILRQVSPALFENVTAASGLDGIKAASAYLLLGPNSPQRPDILLNRGDYFQWNGQQWQNNAAPVFTSMGAMSDAAHADVNGDGLLDLYVVRQGTRSEVVSDDHSVKLAYTSVSGVPGVIDFMGGGVLNIIRSLNIPVSAIRTGASQLITPADPDDSITLDPLDPQVQGEPSFVLESALRVFVWYTPADDYWHFRIGKTGGGAVVEMEVHAQDVIQDVTIQNIAVSDSPQLNRLFINNGDGTYSQDNTSSLRLGPTGAAIMADLDNDMDVDAYVVNRNAVSNVPNQLFENQGDGTFIEVTAAGGATGPSIGNGDSVAFADYDLDGFLDLFIVNGRSDLIMEAYPGPHSLYRNLGNQNNWLQIDLEGTTSNREAIGAVVEVLAGGSTQVRLQDGGTHGFAQNQSRLHFGLAANDRVDRITVHWPSGVVQQVDDMPVNQLIRIIESEPELIPGVPASLAGGADGVYLWKDTFDGPYHLRAIHTDQASATTINLLTDRPLLDAQLLPPAGKTVWQSYDFGFALSTNESDATGGVDFQLRSDADGLYSVQSGTTINPRLVTLGSGEARPSPAGWLIDTADLPPTPVFKTGANRGLFLGRNSASNGLEFRMNGDGTQHEGTLELYAAEPWLADFQDVELEAGDEWYAGINYASATGAVTSNWDGVDIALRGDTDIGFLYTQDRLFQPEAVNNRDAGGELGEPNAYKLPKPSPRGEPQYDPAVEGHVFLWQDDTDRWRLRATAGADRLRYAGRIISDQPPILVTPVDFEHNDSADLRNPLVIRFDLSGNSDLSDGLDIEYPPGTTIRVHIDKAKGDLLDVLRIGPKRWPVSRLPVILPPGDAIPPAAMERATGQVSSFAAGDDGELQHGISMPVPRFDLRPDGTVYDMLTGLIWLANAECFGQLDWPAAVAAAEALNDTECGLGDGSLPGDWRLPNIKEQLSLIDFGETQPALPVGHPFTQVQNAFYWSSTTTDDNIARAWGTVVPGGNAERRRKDASQHPVNGTPHYVWPVKGP